MHPYLPFAALPVAVTVALFAASHWSGSDPSRYRIPAVEQLDDPSVIADVQFKHTGKPDIRVAAFLPHIPPRPPAPVPVLILHSVMTGSDVHLATINGELVREGGAVQGYRATRIVADGVQLEKGGEIRWLPMRPLHELPPPVEPGTDLERQNVAAGDDRTELNQSFWATFQSQ